TGEKERLAAVFLKWFTDPRNNLRFVASTGYLPVTGEAFDELISRESEAVSDGKVKELLTTCQQMQQEYEFFVPPLFEGIDQLQLRYEETFKKTAAAAADRYRQLSAGSDLESACDAAVKQAFADLPVQFQGNS
ncbi:MAG: ABC transporter substrate-binding protein, partial [Firmicutes bacterium]|nr:ABC transporter substrate-binding protein [Bacillota bacterium]